MVDKDVLRRPRPPAHSPAQAHSPAWRGPSSCVPRCVCRSRWRRPHCRLPRAHHRPPKRRPGLRSMPVPLAPRSNSRSAACVLAWSVPPPMSRHRRRESVRSRAEQADRASALLLATYEEQLDLLGQIEAQRAGLLAAEAAQRDWSGFPGKAPYSILLLDEAREEADRHRATADLLKSARGVIDVEVERFRGMAQRAQEELRRATEAVERAAPGTGAYATAAWRLEAAQRRSRLAAEFLVGSDLAARLLDEKLAVSQQRLQLAQRKLSLLAGNVAIDRADIDEPAGAWKRCVRSVNAICSRRWRPVRGRGVNATGRRARWRRCAPAPRQPLTRNARCGWRRPGCAPPTCRCKAWASGSGS